MGKCYRLYPHSLFASTLRQCPGCTIGCGFFPGQVHSSCLAMLPQKYCPLGSLPVPFRSSGEVPWLGWPSSVSINFTCNFVHCKLPILILLPVSSKDPNTSCLSDSVCVCLLTIKKKVPFFFPMSMQQVSILQLSPQK
jgi:hypothetical protein